MTPDFWKERWQTKQISFHEGQPNGLLVAHWTKLGVPAGGRVFVPLCGKSVDMAWLAGQGHAVIGVELSDIAAGEFFSENGLAPQREQRGGFDVRKAGGIEIWCGDFFGLRVEDLHDVTAVYDRAALVALPPDMRKAYAARMCELLPNTALQLLLTFDYDQSEMSGPPFAVSATEIRTLYGQSFDIHEIARVDALASRADLKARGITRAESAAFHLSRR